ncbi:hypothetical protein AGMMS49992_23080 [Clostridia bacterium]|nr:hypothetical protein AGMMS49992_23080 [Clostridia bacterium]
MKPGVAPMRTMVCVTAQRQCERLIRAGSHIAMSAPLSVVHVAPMDQPFLYGKDDAQPLDFLYKIAKSFNADMIVEHNDHPLDAIVDLAARLRIECVVIGVSAPGIQNPFGEALAAQLPHIQIYTE